MFRGTNLLSVDDKGRLSMPAKYRNRLKELGSGQLVITIHHDPCLLIYPLPIWEEVEYKLIQLSSTNKKAQLLKRLLLGHAEECQMDGQGRILLPPPLREYASLTKRVALVGQGNKFELWNEQSWHQLIERWREEGDFTDLPAELESLSF